MSKSTKNMKKNLSRKKGFVKFTRALVKGLILILVIYILGTIAVRETIKTLDYLVKEEQRRDINRFEEKIITAGKDIDKLENELTNVKAGRWVRLSEKQKNDLLKIVWELRKDSLRIENAWLNHQNDVSVTFYPRKDEEIENKFKEYWPTHILIDRVVEDTERIIYSPRGVDKFQLEKLKEDLQDAKIFEKINKK